MLEHPVELSIIVPIYNVEAYLPRCIDSILAQSFTDLELILVDDGSPDRCPQICNEYEKKDPRVRVIHQKNAGPSAARNAGIDAATGAYLGFIDGDDCIHPRMFELLMTAAKREDADIAFCGIDRFFEQASGLQQIPTDWQDTLQVLGRTHFLGAFYPDNRYTLRPELVNKIYRRSVFDNIRLPVGRFYEDAFIQLALLDASEKAVHVPFDLYYYFQRPGSTMHKAFDLWCARDMDAVSRYNLQYFRDRGDKEQVQYALEDYLTMYCRDKTAVYVASPHLKKDFHPIERAFDKEFFPMLLDPKICKMKKVVLVLLRIAPGVAYRLCRRYLPDCLHRDLR